MAKPSASSISIAAVAADAGVSPTTVSHALSGKRAVSAKTRERILASIERMDYRPNLVAAGLRSQRTRSVALLVVDILNPYYPAVARAAHDVLTASGYVPFIVNTDGDAETERRFLREMVARGVDGIIMQPLALSVDEIREVVGPTMPLVVTAAVEEGGDADVVATDQQDGVRASVRYLLERGIRDIGYVNGPEGSHPGVIREGVYADTLAELGIATDPHWIAHASAYTRDAGFVAASRLLEGARRPRALVCANDLLAIGAMDAARLASLHVPDDLAIIGFDDIEVADLVSPRLTTVDNPAAGIGTTCAQILIERMTGEGDEPLARVVLPTRLIVRASA